MIRRCSEGTKYWTKIYVLKFSREVMHRGLVYDASHDEQIFREYPHINIVIWTNSRSTILWRRFKNSSNDRFRHFVTTGNAYATYLAIQRVTRLPFETSDQTVVEYWCTAREQSRKQRMATLWFAVNSVLFFCRTCSYIRYTRVLNYALVPWTSRIRRAYV